MCEYLAIRDFEWNNDEWTKEKILLLEDEADIGYLFSVNISLDKSLHSHFNNYSLFPESMAIKSRDLNLWQQENYKESDTKKLCLTFHDKKDYVVNYRYLKLALNLGYTLDCVNKVLQYTQSNFLKQYIMLNTELRKKSKNDFEKDFYKLLNNSVYGKTMENVKNRINFRLITTEDEALRVKNLKHFTIFNDNLVGLHINKLKVKLNKPIYLGQCILDQSKITMADCHYNFMLKKVKRENVKLMMTDTDSFLYNIKNQDIYKIIENNKDKFDLANYPQDHFLYDKTNNKVVNKFKDEKGGLQIKTAVCLRSKLYSLICEDDIISKNTCKGVKQNVSKKLTINDYNDVRVNRNTKEISQNVICSKKHELYSIKQIKTALSANDDKVYICDDNIHTYNFGYKGEKN